MTHPLRSLASGRGIEVQLCVDCDVLHINVGPVTVRLEPGAAARLHHVLHTALRRMDPTTTFATLEPTPGVQQVN